ncbi:MAG: acyltransferase family protein, partial [Acidimicrobiales bacterium]
MPEPAGRGQRYMPGLDGLRAVAVLAVVAYHLDAGWAQGGLLGVGVFFTLSGYLITDLLLGGWRRHGRLTLGDFWLRRARRLLPALAVMLAVVSIWVAIGDPAQLGALRAGAGAAAVYVSNWYLILGHQTYFSRFGPPSPLGHLWSLAVEEQFYLVWPWLLAGGLWWARRPGAAGRRRRLGTTTARLRVLAGATVVLAALSALEMGLLHHPSVDPTRIYDGTDTRAFGLLFGAALAMVWPSRAVQARVARWSDRAGRLLELGGVVGLAGIVVLVWRTSAYGDFLYPWGMVLLSLATVLVVAAATLPGGAVVRVLGWAPLRWIGLVSYGIYLWHYPIITLTTPTPSRGFDPGRAALQVGATVVVAALSWYLVEEPIRSGALARRWRELGWRKAPGAPAPAPGPH